MKSFFLMAILMASVGVGAETTGDGIHSIVRGQSGEPHMIKFESGAVTFVEQDEEQKLKAFESRLSTQKSRINFSLADRSLLDSEFTPTLVLEESLSKIFKNMNPFMKRKSECSDRAHVWAWDEFKRSGAQTEKAFLMLTDTYIKRHRYKWWFHVAPLFTTTSGKKMVMDKQFFDRPVTFEEWKNNLVFSKRTCVSDFRFLDYDAGADQSQDCYAKFQPMYYYIPQDIGALEQGRPKTSFSESQVNTSRTRAFFKGSL